MDPLCIDVPTLLVQWLFWYSIVTNYKDTQKASVTAVLQLRHAVESIVKMMLMCYYTSCSLVTWFIQEFRLQSWRTVMWRVLMLSGRVPGIWSEVHGEAKQTFSLNPTGGEGLLCSPVICVGLLPVVWLPPSVHLGYSQNGHFKQTLGVNVSCLSSVCLPGNELTTWWTPPLPKGLIIPGFLLCIRTETYAYLSILNYVENWFKSWTSG